MSHEWIVQVAVGNISCWDAGKVESWSSPQTIQAHAMFSDLVGVIDSRECQEVVTDNNSQIRELGHTMSIIVSSLELACVPIGKIIEVASCQDAIQAQGAMYVAVHMFSSIAAAAGTTLYVRNLPAPPSSLILSPRFTPPYLSNSSQDRSTWSTTRHASHTESSHKYHSQVPGMNKTSTCFGLWGGNGRTNTTTKQLLCWCTLGNFRSILLSLDWRNVLTDPRTAEFLKQPSL